MAVYTLVRFAVRSDARLDAERAMHEHATFVRTNLPDVVWTIYREGSPDRFVALIRADTAAAGKREHDARAAALRAHISGDLEIAELSLVTSSDLQRRRR